MIPGAEGGTLDYGEDGQYWYYFGTNGKKYVPSDGNDNGDYGTRKIDGITIALMMTAFYRWAGRM